MLLHAQLYWWGIHDARAARAGAVGCFLTALPMFRAETIASLWSVLLSGATPIAQAFCARCWRSQAGAGRLAHLLAGMASALLAQFPRTRGDRRHYARRAFRQSLHPGLYRAFATFRCRSFAAAPLNRARTCHRTKGVRARPENSLGLPASEVRCCRDSTQTKPTAVGGRPRRARRPPARALQRHKRIFRVAGRHGCGLSILSPHRARAVWQADGSLAFQRPASGMIGTPAASMDGGDIGRVRGAHPDIAVGRVGVGVEGGHDEVMGVMVLDPGGEVNELELLDFCRPRLGPPALPRLVELVNAMPRRPRGRWTGKR